MVEKQMNNDIKKRFGKKVKFAVYERAEGRCEHPDGCEVTDPNDLTIDHFTSRCLGRALGWRNRKINAFGNLQLLCEEHHREKDRTTPAKLYQLQFQQQGGTVNFGEHK